MNKARIISTGYYLPEKILTNKDIEKIVNTTDDWIVQRTGIKERHIADKDEAASDMGAKAAQMAIDKAGLKPDDIDTVICSTITPDHILPSTACFIQKKLALNNAFAFDISAACSGFLYALMLAETLLLQNKAATILVIASEKMSSIVDWKDRSTCVLFGDGAGAAILKKEKGESGILSSYLGSDGSGSNLLIIPAGGSRSPSTENTVKTNLHFLKMAGNEVFKVAVKKMVKSAIISLEKADLKKENIDLVIPHQANLRIIHAIVKRLQLKDSQVYINVDKCGNMSAATIAVALAKAAEENIIKKGNIVSLVAFGAGLTWGGIVIRW